MSRVLAQIPTAPVAVPDAVRELAAGDEVVPVWRNELGGLTFRLTGSGDGRYVKWVPAGTPELDLGARPSGSRGPAGTRPSRGCSRRDTTRPAPGW